MLLVKGSDPVLLLLLDIEPDSEGQYCVDPGQTDRLTQTSYWNPDDDEDGKKARPN